MTRIDSYEDLTDKIVGWLKDYYFDNDIDAFVIGVSGGIDSAVVSSLCARTGLPTYVVCMPLDSKFTNTKLSDVHSKGLAEKYDNVKRIEVELSSRALPRAHLALIDRLQAINARVAQAIDDHDAVTYIKTNLEFHRTLYLRAQAPAMLATAETVWLQLGPTMRALYGRLKRKEPPHFHRIILSALSAGDEPGLRVAVRSDVTQGLRMLKN